MTHYFNDTGWWSAAIAVAWYVAYRILSPAVGPVRVAAAKITEEQR